MTNYLTPDDVSRFWIAERVRQAAASTARRRANAGTVRAMAHPPTGDSDDVDDWPVPPDTGGEATVRKAVGQPQCGTFNLEPVR